MWSSPALIYIDGNHTLEYVKADILSSLKKINNEGVIICDDYGNIGWWNDGVSKAVDQLSNQNIVKKIFIKNNQCVVKKI